MSEYIEREAVNDLIKAECSPKVAAYLNHAIDNITAADVRPVVKAYWIGEGDGYADGEMVYDVWHCSNCDYTVDEGDNEPPRYNFCPNCGAKMKNPEEYE